MSEREDFVARDEFQRLAHRVEALETVVRETLVRGRVSNTPSPVPADAVGPSQVEQMESEFAYSTHARPQEPMAPPPPSPLKVETARPAPAPPPSARPSREPVAPIAWESVIGTKWVERIGALLIVLGVSFFVKFAFDQGWINPAMRIVLGVLFGVFLIGAGETAHRRTLKSYANVLAAAGLAVAYVSLYAGADFYNLYDSTTTIGLLAALSAMGAGLALRYEAQSLAVMAAVGAYLAPILVSGGNTSGGPNLIFLNYLAVVTAGFAFLAFLRSWRGVQGLAFFCAWFMAWDSLTKAGFATPYVQFAYATLFFAEFFAASIALRYREKMEGAKDANLDLVLLLANPGFYYAIAYDLLNGFSGYQSWMTALAYGLAAVYGALAAAPRERKDTLLEGASITLAVTFLTRGLTLTIPTWATLAWCAEALALLYTGFIGKNPLLRTAARIVLVLAVFRLFVFDLDRFPRNANFMPFLNYRFLTLGLVAATLNAFAWLYHVYGEEEKEAHIFTAWTASVALLGVGMVLEAPAYATILWCGLAFLWLVTTQELSAEKRGVIFTLMIGATVFRALFYDIGEFQTTSETMSFVNLRFVTVACVAALMGVSTLFNRTAATESSEDIKFPHILLAGSNLLMLYGLSMEVLLLVDQTMGAGNSGARESVRQFALSALWAAYGGALMTWGFLKDQSSVRFAGLGLLGVVVLKLLFVDLANVETVWRIASFIGVGALLLFISLAYHRQLLGTPEEEAKED